MTSYVGHRDLETGEIVPNEGTIVTKTIVFRKVGRDARTGQFLVVRPAVKAKRFTPAQLRDAVRKVNKEHSTKTR